MWRECVGTWNTQEYKDCRWSLIQARTPCFQDSLHVFSLPSLHWLHSQEGCLQAVAELATRNSSSPPALVILLDRELLFPDKSKKHPDWVSFGLVWVVSPILSYSPCPGELWVSFTYSGPSLASFRTRMVLPSLELHLLSVRSMEIPYRKTKEISLKYVGDEWRWSTAQVSS